MLLSAKLTIPHTQFNLVVHPRVTLYRSDNTSSALHCLAHLLTLTEPQGFVRLFVDEGTAMERLLVDFRA